MRFFFAIIISFFAFYSCEAQPSDILILKKHDRTFQTFFPGSKVTFFTDTHYYDGYITSIHHDSLFVVQYDIRQIPTTLGVYILDTIGVYNNGLNYKEIIGFGKDRNKGFSLAGSGGALFGGGILITTVGLGTWLFTKPNTRYYASPYLVGAAAILAALGYVIAKLSGKGILIGKKYSLEYIGVK